MKTLLFSLVTAASLTTATLPASADLIYVRPGQVNPGVRPTYTNTPRYQPGQVNPGVRPTYNNRSRYQPGQTKEDRLDKKHRKHHKGHKGHP